MLTLSHLTIRHTKDLRDLVRDLSLTIREGEKVEDADISEEETNKLKTLFTYIASFRHTTTEYNATIFDKILAFDFNGIPLIKLCKEVEAILKNGTFISALEFLNSKDKLSQLDNHDNY